MSRSGDQELASNESGETSVTRDDLLVQTVGFLGSLFLKGLNRTLRWEPELRLEACDSYSFGPRPVIILFWHNRQLMMPWVFLRNRTDDSQRCYTLISAHRDGRMIAGAVGRIGIENVPGSSSRRAASASRDLVKILRGGQHAAITPDGPRGPIYECKAGVVRIAQLSGAVIVPVAYGASSYWQFGSWDRMILPKPFARAVFVRGKHLEVPKKKLSEDEGEAWRKTLEEELMRVTDAADSYWSEGESSDASG